MFLHGEWRKVYERETLERKEGDCMSRPVWGRNLNLFIVGLSFLGCGRDSVTSPTSPQLNVVDVLAWTWQEVADTLRGNQTKAITTLDFTTVADTFWLEVDSAFLWRHFWLNDPSPGW